MTTITDQIPTAVNWSGFLNRTKGTAWQVKYASISKWGTWKSLPQTLLSKWRWSHLQESAWQVALRSWTCGSLITDSMILHPSAWENWFPKRPLRMVDDIERKLTRKQIQSGHHQTWTLFTNRSFCGQLLRNVLHWGHQKVCSFLMKKVLKHGGDVGAPSFQPPAWHFS